MSIDGGLRALFRQHLLWFDWCSVESGTTGRGIPDSNYCIKDAVDGRGIEGWVEFKQTPGWTCPLRPEQVGWIMRRTRHGGRVHVAVRQRATAGPQRDSRDVLWLVPGGLAAQAKEHGLRGLPLGRGVAAWHGGPGAWDWRAVAAVLVT